MRGQYHNFWFSEGDIFGSGPGDLDQLESAHEIGFRAQAISRRCGPYERAESVRIDQTDLPGLGRINQPRRAVLTSPSP
jgi:hypothetical protein